LRYAPPERYRYDTRFARFHLHAVDKNDAAAAGPSLLDFYRIAQYRLDEVIITNLGPGSFNVDFAFFIGGAAPEAPLSEQLVTLDLGIYSSH